jgi:hypothetical protein
VVALARARVGAPRTGLDVEALARAGWPEAPVDDGAANRLRVALHRLRHGGLGELLVRGPDGWRLDEAVPLRLAGPEP